MSYLLRILVSGAALAAAILVVGCSGSSSDDAADSGNDGGGDAAGADADADADTDADADGDGGASGDGGGDGGGDAGSGSFAFDADRIYEDVAYFAADERGGRAPGTQGGEDSLARVEALFQELGIAPAPSASGFRQPFSYQSWSLTDLPALEIGDEAITPGADGFDVFSYSGSAAVTDAEIAFVGYGMTVPAFDKADYPQCPLDPAGYDDYAGIDVTDKIVLVLRHGPSDNEAIYNSCPGNEACGTPPCLWNYVYKGNNAALHGAKAMLLVQGFEHGPEIAGGMLDEALFQDGFPALYLNRDVLTADFPDLAAWQTAIDASKTPASRLTGVTASLEVASQVADVTTANLIGVVPGTDPELGSEAIVVGGHIDHLGTDFLSGEIYHGADDNASGTAVMMELARALAASGTAPKRTVVFAAWNAEELGLVGSCLYVASPYVPIADTVAMFSVDMVGAGDGSGLLIYGGQNAGNQWLVDVMRGEAAADGLGYAVMAGPPLDASDHVCFEQAGVPAVLVSTLGPHADYHTPADTIDTILKDDLLAAAELMWSGLEPLIWGTEDTYLDSQSLRGPAPGERPAYAASHPWYRTR